MEIINHFCRSDDDNDLTSIIYGEIGIPFLCFIRIRILGDWTKIESKYRRIRWDDNQIFTLKENRPRDPIDSKHTNIDDYSNIIMKVSFVLFLLCVSVVCFEEYKRNVRFISYLFQTTRISLKYSIINHGFLLFLFFFWFKYL